MSCNFEYSIVCRAEGDGVKYIVCIKHDLFSCFDCISYIVLFSDYRENKVLMLEA